MFKADLLSHFDNTPQLFCASGGRSSYSDIGGPVVTTQVTIPKDVSEWQILTRSKEYLHHYPKRHADMSPCHAHSIIVLFLIWDEKKHPNATRLDIPLAFHLHEYNYSPALPKCCASSSTLFILCLSFHSTYDSWPAPSSVKGVNGSNRFAMTLEPLSRLMSLLKDLKTEL